MDPISNILVIVDPNAQEHPAIAKAALLATRFKARLELFVCDTRASREMRLAPPKADQPAGSQLFDAKSILESLAVPLRKQGLDVTTETAYGDPLHAVLTQRVQTTNAGLVVKDTHHHSLLQRTFLTNTDWQLIRNCPVPLLLTKEKTWAAVPHIVAAVDPGHTNDKPETLDRRILDEASQVSAVLQGELHALHVHLPLMLIAAATSSEPPTALPISAADMLAEEKHKRQQVEKLVADYDIDPARIHIEMGGPTSVLPRAAEELAADIVVMGAISRSGLKRLFIGSTAEQVLQRLPCDALIVKPPAFADDDTG